MEQKKNYIFEIKFNGMKISGPRMDLVSVNEASAEIIFNFRDGSFYTCTNPRITAEMKVVIKNSADRFNIGNLIIDLNNPTKPVSVDM